MWVHNFQLQFLTTLSTHFFIELLWLTFWAKFDKICHSALRLHSRAITGKVPFPKGLLVVCLPSLSKKLSVQVKAIKVFIKIPFSYLQLDLLTIQVNNWGFFFYNWKEEIIAQSKLLFCAKFLSEFYKLLWQISFLKSWKWKQNATASFCSGIFYQQNFVHLLTAIRRGI